MTHEKQANITPLSLAQQGEDAAIYRQGITQGVLVPIYMLPEQARQQEIARLLDYIKNGELTLREAANIVDGLTLTNGI